MGSRAAEVAQALEARKGFKFSAAYVWGGAPFRPDDNVYELLGATANGDRVDIRTLDTSASPEVEVIIAVYSPGKVKATEDEVRVTSATRVSFGSWYDAVAEGDSYRATCRGKPGDSFLRRDQSALRLVIAPSP
jgi:hypothetical protein